MNINEWQAEMAGLMSAPSGPSVEYMTKSALHFAHLSGQLAGIATEVAVARNLNLAFLLETFCQALGNIASTSSMCGVSMEDLLQSCIREARSAKGPQIVLPTSSEVNGFGDSKGGRGR